MHTSLPAESTKCTLRGQKQIIKNKRWMLSTREWLTFLSTNTTSRKWFATPLRHDATLTKSHSDVSRPTAVFRSFVDAKLLNRFRFNIQTYMACLGCCLLFKKTRGFHFTIQAHMSCLSCFLRLNKTRGFRFTIQTHQGCIHRSRTCRDDFLHIVGTMKN